MGAQTKHDEIGICSIDTVRGIWVVISLCSLRSDKVQNLMFSFPQDASLDESMGLNLRLKMLNSEVYRAQISGISPLVILEISQTQMSSLLCLSFPTLAR